MKSDKLENYIFLNSAFWRNFYVFETFYILSPYRLDILKI